MTDPPFRLIAIAGSAERIDNVLDTASKYDRMIIGLMLRSREHRREEVLDLAAHVASITVPANVVLITNGCLLPGIDWSHAPAADVRNSNAIQMRALFGASAHSVDEAEVALDSGAAYLLVSPIYPTPSKPGNVGLGCDELATFVGLTDRPVFALGGVSGWNIDELLQTGIFGVASIGLFDPSRSAELASVVDALYNYSTL